MFLLVLSMSWLSCFDVSGGLLSLQVIVAALPVESRLTWRALLPHRQTVHPFAILAYSAFRIAGVWRISAPLGQSQGTPRTNSLQSHKKRQIKANNSPYMIVFGLWKESKESRENAGRDEENMQIPQKKVSVPFCVKKPHCCEARVLTTTVSQGRQYNPNFNLFLFFC